jgi:hypothetical protein
VAGMSEAAAALGRKDADRWLAKAVIEIVAAEKAKAAAEASGAAGAGAAAGQPQPNPPARPPAAPPPESLFTPRSARLPAPGGTPQPPSQPSSGGGRHRHAR